MQRLQFIFIEILSTAVVLAPLLLLLWRVYFHSIKKTIVSSVFILYLSAVYAVTGLPTVLYLRFEPDIHLIPFIGMASDLKNTVLNIILFVPLGMLLPLLWEKFRTVKSTFLFGFGVTLVIEFFQIFTFRATDINDIIANTAGTMAGYIIAAVFLRKMPFIKPCRKKNEVYILSAITVGIMFFAQPFLSSFLWNAIL